MKALIAKFKKIDFSNKTWFTIIFVCSIFCFPKLCFSQTSKLNLKKYEHIIKDSNQVVHVRVNNNNGTVDEQTTLKNFSFTPGKKSAVFANGTVTSNNETIGSTREGRKIKGLVLPELHVGRVVGNETPVLFQIFIDTIQPLVYEGSNKRYTGQFSITLVEDSKEVLEGVVLEKPVIVEISSGSGKAKFLPSSIQISHTNLPSSSIGVVDSSSINPLPVLIKTDFKQNGYLTSLKKEALLRIKTPSKSLQGMGVQAIPITTSLEGYTNNDSLNITFSIDKGSVEPLILYISKNKPGTVFLRSEGLGPATLTASANGFSDDHQIFTYVFPWMFILFSLVGGIFGALVRYGMDKSKKGVFSTLWFGVITGFIGAILYYVLGIELFTIKLSKSYNEFAILGISFLIALFWQQVFSIIKNIFLKKP